MIIKFIPQIRLLGPSLPATGFTTMKPVSTICLHGSIPVLNRVFPFKLKFFGLSPGSNGRHSVRSLSTRPSRPRSGASSKFTPKIRGDVRASKSLIEDEAELSDWVGELRADSFRVRLTSEDEELDADRECNRVRSRDRNRSGVPVKKRRESEFENFRDSSKRESRGRLGDSVSRNARFSKRFDSELEDEDSDDDDDDEGESYSSRKTRDVKRESKKVDSRKGKRNERDLDSRNTRSGSRNNLGRKSNFSEEEDSGANEEKRSWKMKGAQNFLSEEDSDITDDDDDYGILRKNASSALGLEKGVNQTGSPISSQAKSDSYLSETRFDQISISPLSLKGIKDAGYEKMTVVQEATLPAILKGKDVLAKAKTGTGKTVAFLLPSIEIVSKLPPVDRDVKWPPIHVLVICPTRELATQAASEAKTLLKYHPSIGVQVVIGGTRLALEQKKLQANPCQILVATPGRLRDHLENTAGFATKLMGVKVLVLDEADRLLDMGFRKDIERIIAAVPKQRQTLLFSATVPEEVHQICHIALRRDHEFINTVQEGTGDTHSQVRQMHMVAPLDKHFSLLYVLLKEHIADDVDYKVLVFCTTAMVTKLVSDVLRELSLNVREIHSRKSQSYRTKVSDEFRKSKSLILVTSDVSARGVDYPDVTLVIQVGIPSDRQQYIHRLGRTGRKGKEGQGILLLAPWEEHFLSSIKDLPITKAPLPSLDPETTKKVGRALSHVEMKAKESAYQAWLGYYNSDKNVGKDKYRLVELANEFSRSMGLDNPPAIPKLVLSKMGLRNVPGLRAK
ncbi:DEAD-box ATP-dependent RNA helicase 26 [Hibiscus syriacus]|uniref:ATP-dependent RNA helicase n=1 Tax=Hibiscus syriacus TaxID=106335 RepID=A0A6A2ZNM3_HIBSY|nr:DEAD-box ATP-dependent RNA helicase 31-like [Hibiscus syriacus]KAE8693641.1 DEAD-box ATP-dependent RNA helicase 26 [Hibiscus syriacus]